MRRPQAGRLARPAGDGTRVLDDLARYLFRVAISNSRLEYLDDDPVTFRYRDNRTRVVRRITLSGVELLQRLLRHVLPRRFVKVRYYGLWSRTRRSDLEQARRLLAAAPSTTAAPSMPTPSLIALAVCPFCHAVP